MWIWLLVPFILQAVAIGVDEVCFHVKRGLPKWERVGHPIDTFSVLSCLIYVLSIPFSSFALKGYIGLGIFSCLMVTKDEFIHKHHCPASENWLHALLFLLHPITLVIVGMMWAAGKSESPFWLIKLFQQRKAIHYFLIAQTATLSLFFSYQVVFWNIIWKEKPVLKM